MVYSLSKTEVHQLETWNEQLDQLYAEADAYKLRTIILRALSNGLLDEADVYELLDLLPRIIPQNTNTQVEIEKETDKDDWNEYAEAKHVQYKREINKLHQTLSNWIFLQSAVYRKNLGPVKKTIERSLSVGNHKGMKKLL